MANPETAVYPTSVADDNELIPWTDRFVTPLTTAIDADDTTIIVAAVSPGGDTLNDPCVVTIDNEQIKISSRSGTALAVGSRGYGGTAAAAHAAGATVRGNLTAFMWNKLCANVKAIQTLLGAGGANIATYANRKEYKTTGNFTVPTGITEVRATLIGGGGGGSGSALNNGGGGGGAGEVKVVRLTGLTSGGTITCTYGAAGTASGGGGSQNGGNGGDTTISGAGISGTVTARGGRGGLYAGGGGESGSGAPGGAVGNTTRPGEIGMSGAGAGGGNSASWLDAVSGGGPNARLADVAADTNIYKGGGGGGCLYGEPGAVSTAGTGGSMNASAGRGNGAGGSGGSRDSTVAYGDGAAGLAGAILFEW